MKGKSNYEFRMIRLGNAKLILNALEEDIGVYYRIGVLMNGNSNGSEKSIQRSIVRWLIDYMDKDVGEFYLEDRKFRER